MKAELLGSLGDCSRWQIKVDFVDNEGEVTLHEGDYDGFGELLAVSLRAPVMLYFDMKVERAVAAINFSAVAVRADILLRDQVGSAPVVLLSLLIQRVV